MCMNSKERAITGKPCFVTNSLIALTNKINTNEDSDFGDFEISFAKRRLHEYRKSRKLAKITADRLEKENP